MRFIVLALAALLAFPVAASALTAEQHGAYKQCLQHTNRIGGFDPGFEVCSSLIKKLDELLYQEWYDEKKAENRAEINEVNKVARELRIEK
jgi:hypothetical protein